MIRNSNIIVIVVAVIFTLFAGTAIYLSAANDEGNGMTLQELTCHPDTVKSRIAGLHRELPKEAVWQDTLNQLQKLVGNGAITPAQKQAYVNASIEYSAYKGFGCEVPEEVQANLAAAHNFDTSRPQNGTICPWDEQRQLAILQTNFLKSNLSQEELREKTFALVTAQINSDRLNSTIRAMLDNDEIFNSFLIAVLHTHIRQQLNCPEPAKPVVEFFNTVFENYDFQKN